MSFHPSHKRTASYHPNVEALDDRLLPTCTVTVFGGVLTITGDEASNAVQISQDRNTGVISVLCDGVQTVVSEQPSQIVVRTLGGNDRVLVQTPGAGRIQVDLGSGDDSFELQPGGQMNLILEVNGGDGNDAFNLPLGTFSAFASSITLKGEKGDDTFNITASNLLHRFIATWLWLSVDGGEGADRVMAKVHKSGVLTEAGPEFDLTLAGGDANDRITAIVRGADVGVRVRGDRGNDHLRLVAHRDASGDFPNATVRGGPGNDTCQVVGQVRVRGCEQ